MGAIPRMKCIQSTKLAYFVRSPQKTTWMEIDEWLGWGFALASSGRRGGGGCGGR